MLPFRSKKTSIWPFQILFGVQQLCHQHYLRRSQLCCHQSTRYGSCASFMKQNRLNMLKCSCPRTHPSGTTESRIWNKRWTLLMFTDNIQPFRYEYKNVLTEAIGLHFGYKVIHEVWNQKLLINPWKQYLLFCYCRDSFPVLY